MPERDGLEGIQAFRRECPGVRAVARSGGAFDGIVDLLGVTGCLGAGGQLARPFMTTLERVLGAA
jgi:hypothetical protein